MTKRVKKVKQLKSDFEVGPSGLVLKRHLKTARIAWLQREAEKANKRQDEFLRQQEMKRRFVGGRSAG